MTSSEGSSSAMLNVDFETEFELDTTSGSTLKIYHEGEPNREKITNDRIRNTRFRAKLLTVQYGTYKCEQPDGTYKPESAALILFAFYFGFKNEKRDRFTSVTIAVEFEETLNAKLETPPDRNPRNDPQVKFFAPYQVCGTPSKAEVEKQWSFEGRLGFPIPGGPDLGVKSAAHTQNKFQKHHRMWIEGEMDSDDDHRYDNTVIWTMQENKIEGSGILHDLPAAVVIVLPKSPEHLVKARVTVTPFVAFSLNPLRLRQKRDDPILLDRKTSWGPQFEPGKDFSDPSYSWSSIIKIPTEYEVGESDLVHRGRCNR